MKHLRISILGAGSWGTALAQTFATLGHRVMLWGRDVPALGMMLSEQKNIKYHPSVLLHPNITPLSDLTKTVSHAEVLILAIPSYSVREILPLIQPHLDPETLFISTAKGIENGSLKLVSEIVAEIFGETFVQNKYSVLSGPSFAKDVVSLLPTAVTLACKNKSATAFLQEHLHTKTFHLFSSADVVGVEMAGALKNVVAIAAGASDGFGFGASAKAALITRGLNEIMTLGQAKGAQALTFTGLSGLGDLILTCSTDTSRNRRVGLKLAQGESLMSVVRDIGQVAEGIRTSKSAYELSKKLNAQTPIIDQVYLALYEGKPAHQAIEDLLNIEPSTEL